MYVAGAHATRRHDLPAGRYSSGSPYKGDYVTLSMRDDGVVAHVPSRRHLEAAPASLSIGTAGDAAEWDRFVRASPNGTFCHLSGWREIISGVLGHECHHLVARDFHGKCRGILPLVRVRSRLFGDHLLSMPFLNYGGPIGTPEAERTLAHHAGDLARESGVRLLELRNRHRISSDLATVSRKVTVLLPLPDSSDSLMARFPAKLRSQIRRPAKEGMEVHVGADQRQSFYKVFARNMRDLGTPVLSRRLFDEIARVFEREVVFSAVYFRGQPVAAGCGFIWGKEFELTWASSLREHSRRAPNMLLYWGLMQHMVGRKVATFNFGRCTPNGGTHRFKLQWGGETVPLPWLQWSPTGVAASSSRDGAVLQLATRVWSRMPLAMANLVGPLLARSLP